MNGEELRLIEDKVMSPLLKKEERLTAEEEAVEDLQADHHEFNLPVDPTK